MDLEHLTGKNIFQARGWSTNTGVTAWFFRSVTLFIPWLFLRCHTQTVWNGASRKETLLYKFRTFKISKDIKIASFVQKLDGVGPADNGPSID